MDKSEITNESYMKENGIIWKKVVEWENKE